MNRLLLACACLVGLSCASPAFAADGAAVKVTVKDDKGNPVEGVTVHLTPQGEPGTGGKHGEAKTGKDGTASVQKVQYKDDPLPSGPYLVIVSKDKKETHKVVYVDKGGTAEINLTASQINLPVLFDMTNLKEKAIQAKEACDKKGYDAAIDDLKGKQAESERLAQEYKDAAEALRKARDLPVDSPKAAQKMLDKAAKLAKDAASVPMDAETMKALADYVWLEHQRRLEEHMAELYRKFIADIPAFAAACPAKEQPLYVQGSGCPAGQVPSETIVGGFLADLGLKGSGPDCVARPGGHRDSSDHVSDRDQEGGHD